MRTRRVDGGQETAVLTGMVVSDSVCGRLAAQWRGDMFASRWANIVATWCVQYHSDYGTAPGGDVEHLFAAWADSAAEDDVRTVEKFLHHLDDGWDGEDVNSEYLVDTAGQLWNRVRLARLADDIQGGLAGGDTERAAKAVVGWSQIEVGQGTGIDPFRDQQAIRDAFTSKSEPLVTYPGDLGVFMGDTFERDAFVAFMGATGRGKTWWLLDLAWRAMLQRRRVALFEVGDMSQAQVLRRLGVRAARQPLRARRVAYPVALEVVDGEAQVETEWRTYDDDLDPQTAWQAMTKRAKGHSDTLFRLSVHPNSSLSVAGMTGILDVWARDGWVPDLVVVDYADILAPPAGVQDLREQINANWKALRGMSQARHCCVVTATQADAASYTATTLRRGNFSDDRRKLDHVTAMIGINSTAEEQELGVQRLNFVKRREDEYTEARCCYVAGSFSLGNPAIRSSR